MNLDFIDFDTYLLAQDSRIIHQVWFGTIPNQSSAKKAYKKMKSYRDSWKIKNPTWCNIEWNKEMCKNLVKYFYTEHSEMLEKYTHEIQRCDAVRYLILHRYGGWYADMDYYCNKPLDEAMKLYDHDLYLVQSPNCVIGQDKDHVSNSLMYSKKGNPFWRQLMINLESAKDISYYYTKHLDVMFKTGPGILNKVYSRYKYRYNAKSLPWKLFHPYGINDDIKSITTDAYTIHMGTGTWAGNDTLIYIAIYKDWKMHSFILLIYLIAYLLKR
jgi:mannosyltransferase OCH1-like enzyme